IRARRDAPGRESPRTGAMRSMRHSPSAPATNTTGMGRAMFKSLLGADDGAIDDESGSREGSSTGSGHKAVARESQHVTEIHLAEVLSGGDRLRAPLGQVHVPERAVAPLARVPAQHVERIEAVQERRVEPLALRVVRARLTVDESSQARPRRVRAVAVQEG